MNTQPILTEAEENKKVTEIACKANYNQGLDQAVRIIHHYNRYAEDGTTRQLLQVIANQIEDLKYKQ